MADKFKFEPKRGNRTFDKDFVVRKDPAFGPGHYVFGHEGKGSVNEGKGVMARVAHPDVPARKHPSYNIKVQRGFKTKREANDVAKLLNEHEHPYWGEKK